nr:uncharacterized protein LOC109177058 [Ipomoea batatas]
MNIRKELHLVKRADGSYEVPHPCYMLTRNERLKFAEFLESVKFPDGYASNISRGKRRKVVLCLIGLLYLNSLAQKMITMLETSTSDGNPMTVDQVYDVVMGTRSGYIKGMGNGPKPQTSRSTRASTSHLEEQMKTTMNENSQLKTELADLKMKFQQYEELLVALVAERSNQNWELEIWVVGCEEESDRDFIDDEEEESDSDDEFLENFIDFDY